MRTFGTKTMAFYALMIALAMIFSYVETLLPMPFFVPGMKLGLANLVAILVLYRQKALDAATVSLVRIFLSALLFGNLFSLAYSLSGGCVSLTIMVFLKRFATFGTVGISIIGGVCHNMAQIGVAALLLETGELLYYLPVLLVSGTIAGAVIGFLGAVLLEKLP